MPAFTHLWAVIKQLGFIAKKKPILLKHFEDEWISRKYLHHWLTQQIFLSKRKLNVFGSLMLLFVGTNIVWARYARYQMFQNIYRTNKEK